MLARKQYVIDRASSAEETEEFLAELRQDIADQRLDVLAWQPNKNLARIVVEATEPDFLKLFEKRSN